jgi:hypothetical protein
MKTMRKFTSLTLVVMLLAAFLAFPAAAADYTAQGTGGQTLTMLAPSDISVVSTDGYYLNEINTVLSNDADTVFNFTFSAGMNNYSDALFTGTNLPLIGVYNSYGGTKAAELQYVSGSSAGIFISIAAGTLADGTYYLVFDSAIQGNNADKTLGEDIVFAFTIGEAAAGDGTDGNGTDAGETTAAPQYTYADVDSWAAQYVSDVVANGCMAPVSETKFVPAAAVTRGEFVAILGMARGINADKWTTSAFSDVAIDSGYGPYVAWAYDKGIVNGVGGGCFAPDQTLTREQAMVILYRYAQVFGLDTTASASTGIFTDKDSISAWAKDAVKWGVGSGYLAGYTDGTFLPGGTVSRAVTAKLVAVIVL